MGKGSGVSRSDRRRNARRGRLRDLVPRDGAVLGIDLGDQKQALALVDHDMRVLWRRNPRCAAHQLGGPIARKEEVLTVCPAGYHEDQIGALLDRGGPTCWLKVRGVLPRLVAELKSRGHGVLLITDDRGARFPGLFEGVPVHILPAGRMGGGPIAWLKALGSVVKGRGDANRVQMDGVSFRTPTVFNVGGIGVILILIALYATWW